MTDTDKVAVLFTYDVTWMKSPVAWASRWDVYLDGESGKSEIHWFNILNGILVVVFLSGVLGIILARTVYRDMEGEKAIGQDRQSERERKRERERERGRKKKNM